MRQNKGNIYKITNNSNGLIYVGCTVYSIKKRFDEHKFRCNKTDYKSKLYNSMRKYGFENFTIELIEECDLKNIYEREIEFIKLFDSYNNGLNSTFGGEGCLGYVHSPEIRKKISENTKNGNSHKGKTYEQLYGEKSYEEKLKRKNKVKESWQKMSLEERNKRIENNKKSQRKISKYGIDLVKEIKEKIGKGIKIPELKKQYPQVKDHFLYSLKNNKRWADI